MRVLVYPHSMELGGSQMNAIQIAGALRDRGHEVAVISDPGPLVARVAAMGLEHIELPSRRSRPSPGVARLLRDLVGARAFDVVHGWEWPPILDAFFGVGLPGRAAVVGTVMSMSVPAFLPRRIPLTLGTEAIRLAAVAGGHRRAALLEPPIDAEADRPQLDSGAFRGALGVAPDEILIGIVCRLAPDLKLEGLLSACRAVRALAESGAPVRLAIVGDGAARGQVAAEAEAANAALGRPIVMLTGEMADPRPCYAAADIVLGQGGSALRGMAFAKPVVVVGEDGFSELLTPGSAPIFLHQGWYGLGPGSQGSGAPALQEALRRLISSPPLRAELGRFGRRLVEARFSLTGAAQTMERIYLAVAGEPAPAGARALDALFCGSRVLSYKLERRYMRWMGRAAADDANARAKIAAVLSATDPSSVEKTDRLPRGRTA
ncbi:glycosyltransferase family 4 protein [Rhodoblastus acidophilus]|uniref:Glycosyltransferase family 4 protein n=1 Tax=Candidatus Rhodoblastus alkanivorans TaxID=2954117 RepID=A0ABS9Z9N1_9HYPH|nr:glycosyltransferase family 4 protein [Candidatus Rhodoblastus alkanivorans]MCI4677047.1 glycosyltransferase family 4 protein [Candidatus Rhodoblastus alkanivorans]MCI4684400.1 glycosyltransferase family 4 protein [Candidatus Rhodoblastus alkanivorans]MDI4641721.1 glycosyltransferase family 4 protein [Rhodoblastus acidophilus]